MSDWRLRLVVFVSGAVLMGLEMTGSRVLAIYFGSSIYVWGSIIGIFLASWIISTIIYRVRRYDYIEVTIAPKPKELVSRSGRE